MVSILQSRGGGAWSVPVSPTVRMGQTLGGLDGSAFSAPAVSASPQDPLSAMPRYMQSTYSIARSRLGLLQELNQSRSTEHIRLLANVPNEASTVGSVVAAGNSFYPPAGLDWALATPAAPVLATANTWSVTQGSSAFNVQGQGYMQSMTGLLQLAPLTCDRPSAPSTCEGWVHGCWRSCPLSRGTAVEVPCSFEDFGCALRGGVWLGSRRWRAEAGGGKAICRSKVGVVVKAERREGGREGGVFGVGAHTFLLLTHAYATLSCGARDARVTPDRYPEGFRSVVVIAKVGASRDPSSRMTLAEARNSTLYSRTPHTVGA